MSIEHLQINSENKRIKKRDYAIFNSLEISCFSQLKHFTVTLVLQFQVFSITFLRTQLNTHTCYNSIIYCSHLEAKAHNSGSRPQEIQIFIIILFQISSKTVSLNSLLFPKSTEYSQLYCLGLCPLCQHNFWNNW